MKAPSQVKYALILGIIAVLAFSLIFEKVIAQNPQSNQSLSVSPASQEIAADPGKVTKIKATLRNESNSSLPIKVRIEDFTASGEEGQIALTSESTYSVAHWTSISPNTFTLKPGESKEVTATISVPSSAAGGRYGSFVFSAVGETDKAQTNAAVAQEIASIFLLRISGPVNEQLSLNQFSTPNFLEQGPVPFSMKFKNSGNVHVKAFGLINVTGMFNQKVEDIVVKPTNIFPGAERIVMASLDKPFLFGPYTATAIMYFGSKNETMNSTVSFFVFPVRIAGIIFLILLLLYFMRKRLKKAFKALFA